MKYSKFVGQLPPSSQGSMPLRDDLHAIIILALIGGWMTSILFMLRGFYVESPKGIQHREPKSMYFVHTNKHNVPQPRPASTPLPTRLSWSPFWSSKDDSNIVDPIPSKLPDRQQPIGLDSRLQVSSQDDASKSTPIPSVPKARQTSDLQNFYHVVTQNTAATAHIRKRLHQDKLAASKQ